jgi:hypothetical protein
MRTSAVPAAINPGEQTELNTVDVSKLGTSDDEIRLQFSLAGQD